MKLNQRCLNCDGVKSPNHRGVLECVPCKKAYLKKWRSENKERIKSKQKEHYENNKLKYAQNNRNYVEKNREHLSQVRADYQNSHDREYWIWRGMNDRCYRTTHPQYKDWGGRGVVVFEFWRKDYNLSKQDNLTRYECYKKYIDDNLGSRPTPDHSIDRINNNGNYEPGNLKWSTRVEQANNQRRSWKIKNSIPDYSPIYFGLNRLITLVEFSEETNLPLIVAKYRYSLNADSGWILNCNTANRHYRYKDHDYTLTELSLLSNIGQQTIHDRIWKWKWSVVRAVEVMP